jgi:triosephosphate isomerase (TIM)
MGHERVERSDIAIMGTYMSASLKGSPVAAQKLAAQKLIIGNWKMNGLKEQMRELDDLVARMRDNPVPSAKVVVCPPATLQLATCDALMNSQIAFGAQDCHPHAFGAHTGDIGAEMFANLGATFVIVGHSERRSNHGETSVIVQAKAAAAIRAGLMPIICVGESEAQRDSGQAQSVVLDQVSGSLPADCDAGQVCIAYEPVWAIGTGKTPSVEDVANMHSAIRLALVSRFGKASGDGVPLLYGGSVNPANAVSLLSVSNVDGALVGGASLKADSFYAIISAVQ